MSDFWEGLKDLGEFYQKQATAQEQDRVRKMEQEMNKKRLFRKTSPPNWKSFYNNKFLKYIPEIPPGPDLEDLAYAWMRAKKQRQDIEEYRKREGEGYMAGPIGHPYGLPMGTDPNIKELPKAPSWAELTKPGEYTTELSPTEEAEFKAWFKERAKNTQTNDNPDDPLHFYNARGYWKEIKEKGETPSTEGHLTDKWKIPGHPYFSKESIYYRPGMPAGDWDYSTNPEGDYIPPVYPEDQYGPYPPDQYNPKMPQAEQGGVQKVPTSPADREPDIYPDIKESSIGSPPVVPSYPGSMPPQDIYGTGDYPTDLMSYERPIKPSWSRAASTAWAPPPNQPRWTWLT